MWTTLSCILCLACARNPTSQAVYGVTLASFLLAIAHFLSEALIYDTMSLSKAAVPLTIAGALFRPRAVTIWGLGAPARNMQPDVGLPLLARVCW